MQRTALLVAALLCAGANGAFAQCVPPSPVGSVFCGSGGRLETGAYMGNRRVSDLLFVHGLDDRVGDYSLFSTDPGADPSATRRGLWVRAGGEGFRLKGNDIPGIDSKAELLQAGGDIWQWPLGTGRLSVGAMVSFGAGRTDATMRGSPLTANGRTSGGGFGFNATWYQNEQTRLGWYADTWTQYGRFTNEVDRPLLAHVSYQSHNGMASAETGYAMRLSETSAWVVVPQGQFIYTHNHAYNVTQSDGSEVSGAKRGGWMSRVGVRMYPGWIDEGSVRIKPYAAVNWLYDHLTDEIVLSNQPATKDIFPSSRYELKAGADFRISQGWAGWGDVGWQAGGSYRAWSARAGVKFNW